MKKRLSYVLILVLSILLIACDKGDKDSSGPSSNITINGKVVDEYQNPISGAEISVDDITAVSSSDGSFVLSGLPRKDRYVVKALKQGFFAGFRGVTPVDDEDQNVQIMLDSKGTPFIFNSASGYELNFNGGYVDISANTIGTESGNNYNGEVYGYLKLRNNYNEEISSIMPGGDFSAQNSAGQDGILSTLGYYSIELNDPSGNLLNLRPGSTASFAQPIAQSKLATAPSSIKLWYFDTTVGLWKEQGTATKQGSFYVGQVIHFSDWNCDDFSRPATIKGRLVCNGSGQVRKIRVRDNIGDGATVFSNDNGNFIVRVPSERPLYITIEGYQTDMPISNLSVNQTLNLGTIEMCGGGGINTGQFSYNGITRQGFVTHGLTGIGGSDCTDYYQTGITYVSGSITETPIVVGIPTSSSGTYQVINYEENIGNCGALIAQFTDGNNTPFVSSSGTVTKTGARSMTFSINFYDLLNNSNTITVTGSCSY